MQPKRIKNVLRIDSSARREDSMTRELGDEVVRRLAAANPGMRLVDLDLAKGMPHIDAEWVTANFTKAEERSGEQSERLALSDRLIAALRDADALVLTVPLYNFSVASVP